jgi:hypothetical protein
MARYLNSSALAGLLAAAAGFYRPDLQPFSLPFPASHRAAQQVPQAANRASSLFFPAMSFVPFTVHFATKH